MGLCRFWEEKLAYPKHAVRIQCYVDIACRICMEVFLPKLARITIFIQNIGIKGENLRKLEEVLYAAR